MNVMIDVIRTFWSNLQFGVVAQIGSWNYLILAILVAIEGPIVTLLGAAASASGYLQSGFVIAAAAIGNLTADILWYCLGFAGKIEWLQPYQRWLGIKPKQMDHLQSEMQKHAPKILFFAKLSAGFMIPSLLAAGISKVPLKKWLPTLLIGEMIWTGTLFFIGYHGTQMLSNITRGIEYVFLAASLVFLFVMVILIRKALAASGAFGDETAADH
jgi:membrane protein DedA with SNARE-associated domain